MEKEREMRQAEWYISTVKCANGVEYKTKFPVYRGEAIRFSFRPSIREINRAAKQSRETAVDMGQTLNENWKTGKDEHIVFDFSDAGLEKIIRRAGSEDRDAMRDAGEVWFGECFIDKTLRRACAKAGVALRYDWIISDMDGDTKEPERLHVHMVCDRAVREVAERVWKLGRVEHKTLYSHNHGDLQELADYLIAQVRTVAGRKRHHPSRNLAKPERTKPIKARSPSADLIVPKGCEKIYRSEFQAGRPQMLRYWRPPGKMSEIRETATRDAHRGAGAIPN